MAAGSLEKSRAPIDIHGRIVRAQTVQGLPAVSVRLYRCDLNVNCPRTHIYGVTIDSAFRRKCRFRIAEMVTEQTGSFSFRVEKGWAYLVIPHKQGWTMRPKAKCTGPWPGNNITGRTNVRTFTAWPAGIQGNARRTITVRVVSREHRHAALTPNRYADLQLLQCGIPGRAQICRAPHLRLYGTRGTNQRGEAVFRQLGSGRYLVRLGPNTRIVLRRERRRVRMEQRQARAGGYQYRGPPVPRVCVLESPSRGYRHMGWGGVHQVSLAHDRVVRIVIDRSSQPWC